MKCSLIEIFIITLLFVVQVSPQNNDKRYTHDYENGYMWQDFDKRMIANNVKYDFLSSMLENQRLKNLSGNYKDDLGCDDDVKYIQSIHPETIDLDLVIKMIDHFYIEEDNLTIPIKYAYCYCIKELAGSQLKELEAYRKKITNFSILDLE